MGQINLKHLRFDPRNFPSLVNMASSFQIPFTLTGGVLTAEKLFLTLNLYRVSRLTMTMFFPIATSSIGEISVSIKRIQVWSCSPTFRDIFQFPTPNFATQEFLLREEVFDKSSCTVREAAESLRLEGVSASWYKSGGEVTLKDFSMQVTKGQLCVIGGPVGSGKVRRFYRMVL